MLVVAGAGTGKTTVLVERVVRLVAEGHARARGLRHPSLRGAERRSNPDRAGVGNGLLRYARNDAERG